MCIDDRRNPVRWHIERMRESGPISFHSVIVGNFGDRRPLLFLADNPVKHTIAGPRLPATRHLSGVHVIL
jgi:hypothetical protein